ncbi:hypothetical protein H4R33_000981 [Dimargaris cristalligena]|uniref:Btz domain-containing protein n=1 Tax=Dimargaris cristalligena TaxID=215637 RepID=A0A4Q0A1M3_9FUNG|nr:hypothetical protein H4R33_000981 [Dimargaris cristalligena]RKP39975.1 hypothetical protein BJ085DRAFT_33697 [Dimargaris cristalligena]|eukprot:RKP39975.1 hypothetical protein BJ085DRAFT_33697 [Dimargaris cristalligena]
MVFIQLRLTCAILALGFLMPRWPETVRSAPVSPTIDDLIQLAVQATIRTLVGSPDTAAAAITQRDMAPHANTTQVFEPSTIGRRQTTNSPTGVVQPGVGQEEDDTPLTHPATMKNKRSARHVERRDILDDLDEEWEPLWGDVFEDEWGMGSWLQDEWQYPPTPHRSYGFHRGYGGDRRGPYLSSYEGPSSRGYGHGRGRKYPSYMAQPDWLY